jgi:hypothetical protein
MSLKRLQARVPSATRLAKCKLLGHRLTFHKLSHDGSGKCDAFETNLEQDVVIGALFEIAIQEKADLDAVEGVGKGYEIKEVEVFDDLGNRYLAFTYYATDIETSAIPYSWYLNHVVIGAQETKVSSCYLDGIKATKSKPDVNIE